MQNGKKKNQTPAKKIAEEAKDPLGFAFKAIDLHGEIDLTLAPIEPTDYMMQKAHDLTGYDEETIRDLYNILLQAARTENPDE